MSLLPSMCKSKSPSCVDRKISESLILQSTTSCTIGQSGPLVHTSLCIPCSSKSVSFPIVPVALASTLKQAMGFLERTVRRLFNSPLEHGFGDKSPKLFATPSHGLISQFDLPSDQCSTSSSASSLSSSATFWMSPAPPRRSCAQYMPTRIRSSISKKQIAVMICILLALGFWATPPPSTWKRNEVHITIQQPASNPYQILRPASQEGPKQHAPNPVRWLEQNSNNRHAEIAGANPYLSIPVLGHQNAKPRAALISLVRNSELPGLTQSMRQLEFQWNRKYNYPWIFFNDEPFSDEFKVRTRCLAESQPLICRQAATQNLTTAQCYYEVVPNDHWSLPEWIDEGRFMNSLEYLGAIGVGKGWMVSYRHMCRWNSGFFYKHPRLKDFDWYWRVEPDVRHFVPCC